MSYSRYVSDDAAKTKGRDTVAIKTLAAGHRFADRYRVVALIGVGAMGEVYEVLDEQLGEVVALKRLSGSPSEADVARFAREVRLARRVTHANVARTHDFGVHDDHHFLTMELVRGVTLENMLMSSGGLFKPCDAAHYALAVARGLEAAHAADIVHRDLKPSNVLVGDNGRVLVTDFGIARTEAEPNLTMQREIVGTPLYMAPEQVSGATVDARTDIYAFGVMLYEMLSGAFPFNGESGLAIATSRLTDDPINLRTRGAVPEPLAALVEECLQREPAQRPSDLTAVREALEHWQNTSSSSRTLDREPPPLAPVDVGDVSLAVLPFVYRGEEDSDYLGDGLAEELADVLSRTRGLRVLAFGATSSLGQDPRAVGSQLNVDYVVTGSVQRSGNDVRITSRLVQVTDGEQLWTERFMGEIDNVFAFQEEISQRIAEALRLELDAVAHGAIPREAVELYLRSRRALAADGYVDAPELVEALDRCIEIAPTFSAALACRAVACTRVWWSESFSGPGGNAAERAKDALETALSQAPEHAESHLAHAAYAQQLGDYRTAVRALLRTLEIAPTDAMAHCYLGTLQMEAGQRAEGKRRLELALSLDPTLTVAHVSLARIAFFNGDFEAFESHVSVLQERQLSRGVPANLVRLRAAIWQRDRGAIQELAHVLQADARPISAMLVSFTRYLLGELDADGLMQLFAGSVGQVGNARFLSFALQLLCEVFCFHNEFERAFETFERAASHALCDVDWVDNAFGLGAVRVHPRFAEVRKLVESRAADIRQPNTNS